MQFDATPQTAIVVHVFHLDIWETVIAPRLRALQAPHDILITLNNEVMQVAGGTIKAEFPDAELHCFPNQGMDVFPFLLLIPLLIKRGYKQVLKLHTKKGSTDFGQVWGKALVDALVPTSDSIAQAEKVFSENAEVALLGPAHFFLSGQKLLLKNKLFLDAISEKLLHKPLSQEDWGFFAGSMFWTRPKIWEELSEWLTPQDALFHRKYSQDGQAVHAVERAFGLIVQQQGYAVALTYPSFANEVLVVRIINDQRKQINLASTKDLGCQLIKLHEDESLIAYAGLLDEQNYSSYLEICGWKIDDLKHVKIIQHYLLVGQFSGGIDYSKAWSLHKESNKIDWNAQAVKLRKKNFTSIVMPVYNQFELTKQAVNAVVNKTEFGSYELIVIDNGSDKEVCKKLKLLAEKFIQIRLVRLEKNKNFALGSNLGFLYGNGKYTVFLNNDTEVCDGWLPPLIETLEKKDVYATQPLLIYPDGKLQCMGIVFSKASNLGYPIYRNMDLESCKAHKNRFFQAVTGACMAIDSVLFAQSCGFDPIYINGQEDIDLCLNLKMNTNKLAAYVASSKIIHYESKTSGRSKYVAQNRKIFVHRWGKFLSADDTSIYKADEINVLSLNRDFKDQLDISAVKPIYSKIRNSDSGSVIDMESGNHKSLLKESNKAFRREDYKVALNGYKEFTSNSVVLKNCVDFNIKLAKKRLKKNKLSSHLLSVDSDLKSKSIELGVWNEGYYLKKNKDVGKVGQDPFFHYITYGWKEARNPSELFDTSYYTSQIENLEGMNPLEHYFKFGIQQKISINSLQDEVVQFETLYKKFSSQYSLTLPDLRPIDILVPVYNGLDFLKTLFESVYKNTMIPFRIIVANDCSPDSRVLPLLKEWASYNENFILLDNEVNLGFVGTVNKLSKYAKNHFVLLNTDTELPYGWLERLMYPIFQMEMIATTTPFTNSGTICSFPNFLKDNSIPKDCNVDQVDAFFKEISFLDSYIEIPTGVGFCMGVNKDLVDQIGMFDTIFGKGYGEENDFCQKAINLGYKNIHVTNLFVYHKHGGSFPSEAKSRLINKNLGIINERHPSYNFQVSKTIRRNELDDIRKVVNFKISSSNRKVCLIFDHGLGGGAASYLEKLISKLQQNGAYPIVVENQLSEDLVKIKLWNGSEFQSILSRSMDGVIKFLLRKLSISDIFINSIVGYGDVGEVISDILEYKVNQKIIVPLHDYYPICPSFTLLNDTGRYCGVPADLKVCDKCIANNNREFKKFTKDLDVKKWRNNWGKLLEASNEVLAFSQSSINILLKAYPSIANKIELIPHDITGRFEKIYIENISVDNNEFVIGVLGGINEAKGVYILKEIAQYIERNNIAARIVVFGETSIDIKSSSLKKTGKYNIDELPALIKKENVSSFLIPSIWPETFSYTTDEVIQLGYPLAVFDLGAPAERVIKYSKGKILNKYEPEYILNSLRDIGFKG